MSPKRVKGVKATEIFRRIACGLHWCDACNVPIVGVSKCPLCGSVTRKVKLAPPGDVRIAFESDLDILRRAARECLGAKAVEKIVPRDSFVLLNRIQAIDVAYEVLVDGYSVGTLYFDPEVMKWSFRLMYYGAKLAIEEELAGYLVVNKIIPGKVVHEDEVLEKRGDLSGKFVVVVDKDRNYYGIAKKVLRGFAIVKKWRIALTPKLGKGMDLYRALEANMDRLTYLESLAKSRINKAMRLGKPFVTVSGGKDSSVVAYIASMCGIKNFVFVDTGLELPETYEQVDKLEKVLGFSIERIGDPRAFWKHVEVLGPPARDYRWCSRVCKLAPISTWCKSTGCNVSLVGQRRYESTSRALAGPISVSGSTAKGLVVAPIHEWSSLEVYLYAMLRKIPINELYMKGFDRVGCFMCPTSRLAEFEHVKLVSKESWSRWIEVLERWRRRWGLPKEWIDLGLWRWRFSYPAEIVSYAKKKGFDPRNMIMRILGSYALASIQVEGRTLKVYVVFRNFKAQIERLYQSLYAVNLKGNLELERNCVTVRNSRSVIVARKDSLEISIPTMIGKNKIIRLIRRALKAWFYATPCITMCRLCENVCHKGAVSKGEIDVSKCSSCAKCVFICPKSVAADNVINMILPEVLSQLKP